MIEKRIKISSVVESQLPAYVREDFPLVGEFLSQYYEALDNQSGIYDILQNIDQYVKVENLTNIVESTALTSSVDFSDRTISVKSTKGFPDSYGLLKIDAEIITYTSKTNTSFEGCVRGFSGVTSYQGSNTPDQLVFTDTSIDEHDNGVTVSNLSILFLKEFFKKVKRQFVPGFDERTFDEDLNTNLFVKQAKDFYTSKGTNESFEILFRALYGEDVTVIKPSDHLIIPSSARYKVTRDLVVEALKGNPEDLINKTLYQDKTGDIDEAYGSVTNVEKIVRDGKEYYVISLDFSLNQKGSLVGEFSIHPQTKLVTPIVSGTNTLDVDSTIGFPKSGTLIIKITDDIDISVTYQSKTYTQFLGCSGVDRSFDAGKELRLNAYAYGYSDISGTEEVEVRVTGVLSNLHVDDETKEISAGDEIEIKTLGKNELGPKASSWLYNIATNYDVGSVSLVDSSNFTYKIETKDDNIINLGDSIVLALSDESTINTNVVSVLNEKSFNISGQGQFDHTKLDNVKRSIQRANSLEYTSANVYASNIQNTYVSESSNNFYLTSNSLPSYLNEALTVTDRSVTFSGTFSGEVLDIGKHGFYTGDSVTYKAESSSNTLNISERIFFVRRVSDTSISISGSRSNLYNGTYVEVSGTVTNSQFRITELADETLDGQKLVKTLTEPDNSNEQSEDTTFGPTGILVNGVEVLNYKSKDKVFFGGLEQINVLSGGSDYDVINPPVLQITDAVGTGATGYCEVEGKFDRIEIIDGGFDYVSEPIVSITGGNGSGATAKANLFEFKHEVSFNTESLAAEVNLTNDTVGFSSFHKFRNSERVVYEPDGQTVIGGLSTSSTYFVAVQNSTTVKLHNTELDAFAGINTVNLTSFGVGNHRLVSTNLKKKITSIDIIDSGSGYKNRKISVPTSGINTYSNVVTAKNHRYSSGEILVYTTEGTEVGGLNNSSSYYVTVVDENNFRLSEVGTATTAGISTTSSFFYDTRQYIDLTSSGSGFHTFNYPPISVTISGIVGVSTRTEQNLFASVQPVVRGEIKSVFLEKSGSNYGSEEVLNFNRQANVSVNTGRDAQVIPVVSAGKITEILVTGSGSGYNTPPRFEFDGPGFGCKLTPVLEDGRLVDVKVIFGGKGYDRVKSSIKVISSGTDAKFETVPKQYTVNLVERLIQSEKITDDDGIIDTGINSDTGLQFTHAYAPRKLRKTISSFKIVNGVKIYTPDLRVQNNKEILSTSHSPIIGWAYDGNPIYGPYGFSNIDGSGVVKALESGYTLSLSSSRPSTTLYPIGFFVEDYVFDETGDLDEHNGRFCVTPEYPDGVYAYFSTINSSAVETTGAFKNFRKPVFPYFIGNGYKSVPIENNFISTFNQDALDITSLGVLRNTTPYGILNNNSGYKYLINSNNIRKQTSEVTFSSVGTVDSVGILTGGTGYAVGDVIIFNNKDTSGQGASAKVSSVVGKGVTQVSNSQVELEGVEFIQATENATFFGFAAEPHNLSNGNIVSITGLSTYGTGLSGNVTAGIRSETFSLITGIGTTGATGIVTYISLYGNLQYPTIRENDILAIENEKVKVLNVELEENRVRIQREHDSTVGASHTAGVIAFEDSRKFTFPVGVSSNLFQYKVNKELYFNPKESVALGTSYGVGIGSTLTFENPGVGNSSLFVPTRSIFLPGHNLVTGDKLVYSSNGGTAVSVSTDGSMTFALTDEQTVFAARISDDLIGIATNRVGLGSTGGFVGINSSVNTDILYFNSIGAGVVHSLTTNYGDDVITGKVNRNLVTVSTASTHGILVDDNVKINCESGIATNFTVRYNDSNRRILINPRDFVAGNITLADNTITINSHGFSDGDKVIHTATTSSGGLVNDNIYFIIRVDNNTIRLAKTFFEATSKNQININITSASSGTLSLVNPEIKVYRNQPVVFDVSHSSLSFTKNSTAYSAFDLNFYTDSNFRNSFETSNDTSSFNVIRTGSIGVNTDAKVTLNVTDNVPQDLFYTLDPIETLENPSIKVQRINDSLNISNNNKVLVLDSVYSGNHVVSGVTTDTFSFTVFQTPERSSYLSTEAVINYTTSAKNAYGAIADIEMSSQGRGYKVLPGITSVSTKTGSNAVVEAETDTIGRVEKFEIQNIGFDYSADKSVRPTAKLSQVLKLDKFNSINRIGITSVGKYYTIAPDLVALDGITGKVIGDLDLTYDLGDSEVTILKNTKGIQGAVPTIIPTSNSNGVGINSISYDSSTKEVTVGLAVSYSSTSLYPFVVGDKVLVENTSVGIGTTLRGFNSSAYNYARFTITSINANIGGANGTITYSVDGLLNENETPGSFDLARSSGIVTPEKYFPIFDVSLQKNKFNLGETVFSDSASGKIETLYPFTDSLKVLGPDTFAVGEVIIGQDTNSEAVIREVSEYSAVYDVDSSSIVRKGWNNETGFLNNSLQKVHDSDYYQFFSYAVRSQVALEKWENAVSSMNHTAGFKKFSDLVVESREEEFAGITTSQSESDVSTLVDYISVMDTNCVNDFDLATENSLVIDSGIISDEIAFSSKILKDYTESIGNRVLLVDDISGQFNSNERTTRFTNVGTFRLDTGRARKFITYVRDRRFTAERQISLVTTVRDDNETYLNEYGQVETAAELGSFDLTIRGDEASLQFYPVRYELNNFDISYVSYGIENALAGVGTTTIGDIVNIESSNAIISSGSTAANTILGISSSYTSSKVLVQIGATDSSYHEFNEVTILHDGSNVDFLEYGQLITSTGSLASSGVGTYGVGYSGSNINLTFTPTVGAGVSYIVNTIQVSIANTASTGIGTEELNTGILESAYTSIGSSTAPVANTISDYTSDPYHAAYYIVSVEDTTNNKTQVSEVVVADDGTNVDITEFGNIYSDSSLGDITADISGEFTRLRFTPNANIDVQVRVYQNALRIVDGDPTSIDLSSAIIDTGFGVYLGTKNDIKRAFNLTHKNLPVFERYVDGSDSNVVSTSRNTVLVPQHYFVTGEKLSYTHAGAGTTQAIGIATVNVPGVGSTDKLPSTVYAVKESDLKIKFAASAENALKASPVIFDITSVGIGTSHRFVSTNQNARGLFSIDNNIQSPIVSTAVTTTITQQVLSTDDILVLSGITSISGGDLLKINDEIVRVDSVGIGTSTNNIRVRRTWMGTTLAAHAASDLVTKVEGDYNIVDNVLNFISAPIGPNPISSTTNPPDSRDFTGITTHSTFSGRAFMRSGTVGATTDSYAKNYVFDDVSQSFTGIQTSFLLQANGQNIIGINSAVVLINEILQEPSRSSEFVSVVGDINFHENVGVTSVQFTGTATSALYDINTSNLPSGGVIVSVGSSAGLGYQPLVAAGGTAVISGLGTITSISIGNSGSGYRAGIQTVVNVGIATSSTGIPNIEFIGTAAISGGHIVSVAITNPGAGYTATNAPVVIFDDPLSYSNVPLVYSSESTGIGTQATVDIVVGQGSSVIDFEIRNTGYGYGQGQTLTVAIGGTSGIPTDTSYTFEEFHIDIDSVQTDKFSAWTFGDLEVIDKIENLFDGVKTRFPLKVNGFDKSILARRGSSIEVKANLLVFLNDILQVPDQGYIFNGGSLITFTEAPKVGDTCKILFYKGTGDVDVAEIDALETVTEGDTLKLYDENIYLEENPRLVKDVISSDIANTNPYAGPGITRNESFERAVVWCRQTEDVFINGKAVGKDRDIYEPRIQPTSNIIQPVGVGSTTIYVESVKTFFDNENEFSSSTYKNKVRIVSQDTLVGASATAVVSGLGTISSIVIDNPGIGYTSAPSVTIANPVGLGTTQRAEATATISAGGTVTSISITSPGTGYTSSTPPVVLISQPVVKEETITNVIYSGDFGVVSGVNTTSVGVASTGIVFDLYIPQDSFLRDANLVGTAVTVSGISTGDYFIVRQSNIGNGVTSLYGDGTVLGIGTEFLDNVYEVATVSIAQTNAVGYGTTYVAKVTVSVSDFNGLTGLGHSQFFGEYSWGKLSNLIRSSNPEEYSFYGFSGISTSASVIRSNPLKYDTYLI